MKPITQAKVGEQINATCERLQDAFRSHLAEFRKAQPEMVADDGVIFEAWAIQKIAGLQFVVLSLEHRIAALEVRKQR